MLNQITQMYQLRDGEAYFEVSLNEVDKEKKVSTARIVVFTVIGRPFPVFWEVSRNVIGMFIYVNYTYHNWKYKNEISVTDAGINSSHVKAGYNNHKTFEYSEEAVQEVLSMTAGEFLDKYHKI
jgi:hypothetical protein